MPRPHANASNRASVELVRLSQSQTREWITRGEPGSSRLWRALSTERAERSASQARNPETARRSLGEVGAEVRKPPVYRKIGARLSARRDVAMYNRGV